MMQSTAIPVSRSIIAVSLDLSMPLGKPGGMQLQGQQSPSDVPKISTRSRRQANKKRRTNVLISFAKMNRRREPTRNNFQRAVRKTCLKSRKVGLRALATAGSWVVSVSGMCRHGHGKAQGSLHLRNGFRFIMRLGYYD